MDYWAHFSGNLPPTILITVVHNSSTSGVARPGPTRACALPSTFQALPSRESKSHVIYNELDNTANCIIALSLLALQRYSISVWIQHIVNLLINTATYKIFQAIECSRNLQYDGSRDPRLNFQKWRQRFSVKTIIMNCVMDPRLELQWKVVTELQWNCFSPVSGYFTV